MRIEILGALRVTRQDGVAVDLGSPAERRLFAILLTRPREAISDDRLIDELWGDRPPPSARHLLSIYVSRLRAALGADRSRDRLRRDGGGYGFAAEPGELDAERFTEALREARVLSEGNATAAHDALSTALALWRGAPFADVADPPPSVAAHSGHLDRLRLEATRLWADVALRLGMHHEVLPELAALAAEHAFDEELHAQLMLALYRSGRQAEALEVARDLQARLREELGVEASATVRDLYRDILLQAPQLAPGPALPPSNAPRPVTSFVGRERELDDLGRLIAASRLVTVTGAGGIGKTRLALETAERLRPRFPGGTWWVDMAPVPDSEHVVDEAARALGLARATVPDVVASLTRAFHDRRALLVLDNCEHVAGGAAALVSAVLRETIEPHVLVTSRVPLHVTGECVFAVPTLTLPDPAQATSAETSDAVRLFVERGRAAASSFALTPSNAEVVAEVCRRLDGLPLAIEMAAARIHVLAPAELVQHLHHRLELLSLSSVDATDRHRTLDASIDVSYALLSEPERRVFERLSVFAGAFDLDAAAAIALPGEPIGEVVRNVAVLVEASMLTAVPSDGGTRYRMLETLRAYGARCLARHRTDIAAHRAHADYYLAIAEEAGSAITTPAFATRMPGLIDAYDELRAALRWSLAHEPPARALRAAPALWEFWFRRGDAREAGRWATSMMSATTEAVPPLLLAAVHQAASFAADLGNDATARMAHSDRAVELAREARSAAMLVPALWGRANVAFLSGDIASMRANATEALEVGEGLPNRAGAAGALAALGYAELVSGNLAEAAQLFDETIPLYRELKDAGGLVIMGLGPRCGIAIESGDLPAAEWYGSQAVAASRGTGWEASALVQYGDVLFEMGDPAAAARFERNGIGVALEAGQELWFRRGCRDLARTAASTGDLGRASLLLGAASQGLPGSGFDPRVYRATEARCRAGIGDSAYERLAEEGRSLSHAEVIERLVADREA